MNFLGGGGQLIKYCRRPGLDLIETVCKVNLKMFYSNSKEIWESICVCVCVCLFKNI